MSYLQAYNERLPARIPILESASADLFRTLIESFSDFIWQTDSAGLYVYVSAGVKTTLGYEPAELLGKTPFSIMSPDEAKRVADVFGPIAAQHRPFSLLENTVLHKDGREIVLETSGRPLFDQQGRFRAISVSTAISRGASASNASLPNRSANSAVSSTRRPTALLLSTFTPASWCLPTARSAKCWVTRPTSC